MSGDARCALVTGASTGIGRAIAVAFGELGWRVALASRRADPLAEATAAVRAAGGETFSTPLDVGDAQAVETFLDALTDDLGPVDVLVNNAGIGPPGTLAERSPEDLEREVRTNLIGPMLLSRLVITQLEERGAPGDLVFVSSDSTRNPRPLQAPYSATKAGVEGLASALALELEGTQIRCIKLRPGPVITEFSREWDPDGFDELLRQWRRFGLQRHLEALAPEDVAAAVVYAVTAPRTVHLDTIEIQPLAPRSPAS
ncbi:MAG: SDR family oxidoreductase [Acidimicrobiia bacterium]